MARRLREQFAGARYHVYSRGDGGAAIFAGPWDKEYFLSCVSAGLLEYGLLCHAYCIMDTHYHLLLEAPECNLSELMHFIGSAYGTQLRDQGWIGHVFSGRFNSEIIEPLSYLLALSRYIHRNPVKAGVFETPQEYPWSSYSHYALPSASPLQPLWMKTEAILAAFHTGSLEARRLYREFVEQGTIPMGPAGDHASLVSRQNLAFMDAIDGLPGDLDPKTLHQIFSKPLKLDEIEAAVCCFFEIEHLNNPAQTDAKKLRRAMQAFIFLAGEYATASKQDVGKMLGDMSRQAVIQQQARTERFLERRDEASNLLRDEILSIQAALGMDRSAL